MLSQLATRVTVSMAFLAAAMVFSPYPLLDQDGGPSAPQNLLQNAGNFADSSKQFVADISKQTKNLEQVSLNERAEQVEGFRDSIFEAVQEKVPTTKDSFTTHLPSGSKEPITAAGHYMSQGAKRVAEAGNAVFEGTKDAAASSIEKVEQAASSVGSEAHKLKQDGVGGAHSVLETVENAGGAVTDEAKEGVQKAKVAGQGLKEKLEAVTAHIRESTSWPEPEAINIMAEGVWAPKEQNPLPNLIKFLDPDRVHIAPNHIESSVEEKLGLHGTSSNSSLTNGRLWKTVKWLFSPVLHTLRVVGGPFYDVVATPARLKFLHLLAVLLHLGVALWLFQTECLRLLRKAKIVSGGGRQRRSLWVEAACSLTALVTFLSLYPWARSGAHERNEVQVLAGTAVESLVRLLWRGAADRKASGTLDAETAPSTPTQTASKKKKIRKSRPSAELADAPHVNAKGGLLSERPRLSATFSLLTRLSVVAALSFHLSFLSSWFRAK